MTSIKKKYKILAGVTFLILVLDQITKYQVHFGFYLGESIPVIPGFFNLTYVRNTGAAFGLLATADPSFRVPFFLIVPVLALIAILYVFRKVPDDGVRVCYALSLVMGGAIGNLIDRANLGFVVDFFDFHWKNTYHFPAFNIADAAICVGVGLLMLDVLFQKDANVRIKGKVNASSAH